MRRIVLVFVTALAVMAAPMVGAQADSSERASNLDAQFPGGKLKVGDRARITGVVTGSERVVKVQVRTDKGWLEVGKATSTDDGTFKVPAPTWWAGAHEVRLFAPAAHGYRAATSTEATLKAAHGYAPRKGRAWSYLAGKVKARWNPCRPITYRVNPRQMPKGAMADVRGALSRISAATGLRFQYGGKTSYVPMAGRSYSRTPLTIAWATPRQVPALAGRTIGRGGAVWFTSTTRGWHQIVSGYTVLDSTWRGKGGFGNGLTRGGLLLHELGHAMGLGHVHDSRQIMSERLTGHRAEYATGDLLGLAEVGAENGCF